MVNTVGPILFFLFAQFTIPAMQENSSRAVLLGSEKISLEKRYDSQYVNDVFKDNILLNLHYLAGKVTQKEDINWDQIEQPISYRFTLPPNKTFAFHEDVLEKYKNSVVKTTNAQFNYADGFKSDGYLAGDGVCHLASLMYWVAKSVGLDAEAPTNHNFAQIPEIAREYGVSIYKSPGQLTSNARQNLYITNNKEKSVIFELSYKNNFLRFSVYEEEL